MNYKYLYNEIREVIIYKIIQGGSKMRLWKRESEKSKKRETLGAVTHTHTHTHTQA